MLVVRRCRHCRRHACPPIHFHKQNHTPSSRAIEITPPYPPPSCEFQVGTRKLPRVPLEGVRPSYCVDLVCCVCWFFTNPPLVMSFSVASYTTSNGLATARIGTSSADTVKLYNGFDDTVCACPFAAADTLDIPCGCCSCCCCPKIGIVESARLA